jgi:hypothetical protein
MTDRELDAIRTRERAASPGPWRVMRVSNQHASDAGDGHSHPALRGLRAPKRLYERAWQQIEADMEFMAGAREDVPALLQEMDGLRAALKEVRHRVVELAHARPYDDDTRELLAIVQAIDKARATLAQVPQDRSTLRPLVQAAAK